MPGHWDDSLKLFISENPQDFASWLLGEAQVKVKLLTEFKTMSDILRETWAYQEIMKEGELRARHQDVLDVIQARFPEILPYAKKQMEGIKDTEVLRRMNVKMSTVLTAEEALQYFFTLDETKRN